MSGNAAKEISDMLTTSMSTVESIVSESKSRVESLARDGRAKLEQGIDIAHKCGSALEEIVHQASDIGSLITEITTAVKEQSRGIVEVSKAMGLLDQASNQNSITSKETLESSHELKDQVKKLDSVIDNLSTMITSKSH
jgi:methyl-accepting chemotaxis protein